MGDEPDEGQLTLMNQGGGGAEAPCPGKGNQSKPPRGRPGG